MSSNPTSPGFTPFTIENILGLALSGEKHNVSSFNSTSSSSDFQNSASTSSPPVSPEDGLSCEFCGKTFNAKNGRSNLIVHRRSHTNEKPYKCTLCPYASPQSSKITRHMRIHAVGEKQLEKHICRFCRAPFNLGVTLEKHERRCSAAAAAVVTDRYA